MILLLTKEEEKKKREIELGPIYKKLNMKDGSEDREGLGEDREPESKHEDVVACVRARGQDRNGPWDWQQDSGVVSNIDHTEQDRTDGGSGWWQEETRRSQGGTETCASLSPLEDTKE
jgi:hypothetical protein